MDLNDHEKKCCTWHVRGNEILFYVSVRAEIFWNPISNLMVAETEKVRVISHRSKRRPYRATTDHVITSGWCMP